MTDNLLPFASVEDLKRRIQDVPDFPKPGIMFKDITPLLGEPKAFRAAIDQLCEHYHGKAVEAVASAEARGYALWVLNRPREAWANT